MEVEFSRAELEEMIEVMPNTTEEILSKQCLRLMAENERWTARIKKLEADRDAAIETLRGHK